MYKGRNRETLVAIPEVAAASAMVQKVLQAIHAGESANGLMDEAKKCWTNLREGKAPANLSWSEFQELQGRLFLPTVAREGRYPDEVVKQMLWMMTKNASFMWGVVQDYREVLEAVPDIKVLPVTKYYTARILKEYEEKKGKASRAPGEEFNIVADSAAVAMAAKGEHLQYLKLFAGLIKKEHRALPTELDPEFDREFDDLHELRERLKEVDAEITELLALGVNMDVVKFAAAQEKKKQIETEIADLEKEEPDTHSVRLNELREQLAAVEAEIAELLKLGVTMDVVKFAAAQEKKKELEAEIAKLEKEPPVAEPPGIKATDAAALAIRQLRVEELQKFLGEVDGSALTEQKKEEFRDIAVIQDLETARTMFAEAVAAVSPVAPERKAPTTAAELKVEVAKSDLPQPWKDSITREADGNFAKALRAFLRWVKE